MPATLYPVTGEEFPVLPANGTDFCLKELYRMLDTDMVEIRTLSDGKIMIIDEEGKLKNRPRNDIATVMDLNLHPRDYIVGDVIVCTPDMFL